MVGAPNDGTAGEIEFFPFMGMFDSDLPCTEDPGMVDVLCFLGAVAMFRPAGVALPEEGC